MRRFIKPNASTRTPTNILIVDTETKPDASRSTKKKLVHKLFMGVCKNMRWEGNGFSRQAFYHFKTKEAFWGLVERLNQKDRPLTIYSHNAGFDATILGMWELIRLGYVHLSFLVSDSPPTIISGSYKGVNFRWIDSLNWFRNSLEEIGEVYGIHKLPFPKDYVSEAEWARYCEQDVKVLSYAIESLYEFVRENDLGVLRSTVGGQSLQTFRHRFCDRITVINGQPDDSTESGEEEREVMVICPHDDKDAIKVERASYYNGDRWIWRIGKVGSEIHKDCETEPISYDMNAVYSDKTVFRLDVNSLYPYVMVKNKFPIRLLDCSVACSTRDILRISKDRGVIAECQVDTDTMAYPLKWKGISTHATGRFWTTLAGIELINACRRGHIRQVGLTFVYELSQIFQKYISFFNEKRIEYLKNGNKPFADLCKSMMVSLYGKFAQTNGRWSDIEDKQRPLEFGEYNRLYEETERIETFRALGDITQIYRKDGFANHSFFAIPAYVTSYAREYMRHIISVCRDENMYYTYIDSIHCNLIGFERLRKENMIDRYAMGKLKIEEVAYYADYRDIGDYAFGRDEKVIGLSRKAIRKADNVFTVLNFEKLDSVIQRGGESTVLISEEDKTLERKLIEGSVNPDKTTKRLHLLRPEREEADVIYTQCNQESV